MVASNRIVWTERAIRDLQSIREFISKYSESQAIKQLNRIFLRESQLTTTPNSGGIQIGTNSKFEVRYLVQDNYKILYRHTQDEVFILTIFDTHQDPEKLKTLLHKTHGNKGY